MSFHRIWDYINSRQPGDSSIGEGYGTDHFALFLNSIIRMRQPEVVVELGTGAAVTALMAAEALKHNCRGHLWTVDDGSQWDDKLRTWHQRTLGYENRGETYSGFISRLIRDNELDGYITPVMFHLDETSYFSPSSKIDMLFADATSSSARGCASLLRYYLPKMSAYSSIFIDRASTIHHSYLFLNQITGELNHGRIPLSLIAGLEEEELGYLRRLVASSYFSITHLTETAKARVRSATQNSRAWITIEPRDYIHHNDVKTYM